MASAKPIVAITIGDPAGVGPEVVARAVVTPQVQEVCTPVVVGSRRRLEEAAGICGVRLPGELKVEEPGSQGQLEWGRPSAASGAMAAAAIELAWEMCMQGRADAMATAPISKAALAAAGYRDTGHTTMLKRLCKVERVVMMLAGARLKVALVTIHCALKDVPTLITTEGVAATARLAAQGITWLTAISRPRLAIAGLNPHAGEGGMFGDEEERIIAPAVEQLKAEGLDVAGPLPPDTVFYRAAQGEFDGVVAMYHDQGLGPLKLIHFDEAVNITLGLPIVRTSADHGTAFDIAGKGLARPTSMIQAIIAAATMARARRGHA